jgi:hypothetical protein
MVALTRRGLVNADVIWTREPFLIRLVRFHKKDCTLWGTTMTDDQPRWREFPDSLQEIFEGLWQETVSLHAHWELYFDLYGDPNSQRDGPEHFPTHRREPSGEHDRFFRSAN